MVKEIQLTRGKVTLVDDEDYEHLMQWKWHFNGHRYAVRRPSNINGKIQKLIFMHRIILNTPDDLYTDHIDCNGLNNQKNNLRIVTKSQNGMNQKASKGGASKYKGVNFCKRKNKWRARLKINQKSIFLGYYNMEDDAAKAYNERALSVFEDFAKLNIFN